MKKFGSALSIGLVAAALSVGASAQETGLRGELTPYVWLAGIDGTVSAAGRSTSFDASFSDLVDNVDGGFMGLGILRFGRFVVFGQYDAMDLGADGAVKGDVGPGILLPPGTKIDGQLDTTIGTIAVGYTIDTFGDNTMDILVGQREFSTDIELRARGNSRSTSSEITDTIIMLRPSFQLSEKWRFNPTMSYGLSGDSDTTYELQPQFQYQIADSFAARIGYRKLYYKESSGSRGTNTYTEFDGDMSGLLIGVGWTFPNAK